MPENIMTVTVPLDEYNKLIEAHTRLVIIKSYLDSRDYLDKKDIMKIID